MALALVQAINFLQALEVATQLLAGFFYAVLQGWLASQKSHESGLGMQFSCKVGPTMFKALGLITNTTKKQIKTTMGAQKNRKLFFHYQQKAPNGYKSQNIKPLLFWYPFLLSINRYSTYRPSTSFCWILSYHKRPIVSCLEVDLCCML